MLKLATEYGSIDYCIEDYDPSILYLDFIEANVKGSGHGRIMMRDFIKLAKGMQGVNTVTLIACQSYGVSIDSLERFYKLFGFDVIGRSNFGSEMELRLYWKINILEDGFMGWFVV